MAAGLGVLACLAFFAARLTPYYIRNYQLQQYVEGVTQRPEK